MARRSIEIAVLVGSLAQRWRIIQQGAGIPQTQEHSGTVSIDDRANIACSTDRICSIAEKTPQRTEIAGGRFELCHTAILFTDPFNAIGLIVARIIDLPAHRVGGEPVIGSRRQ